MDENKETVMRQMMVIQKSDCFVTDAGLNSLASKGEYFEEN